jgi:hypothetical protein
VRRVCLTLPTNRACGPTLTATIGEAAWAAEHFDVEVHLLVLDSSEPAAYARHAELIAAAPAKPGLVAVHLDEAAQEDFLRRVAGQAQVADPELVLGLMLPEKLSYGACTNRAFLIAAALGCESVHRRDSDSQYQELDGVPVYPIEHELRSLGRRAADVTGSVTEVTLTPAQADRPVAMVGSSFVGELSVDIGEIFDLDPGVYADIVSLWAPLEWSEVEKKDLVEESFKGAGHEIFDEDVSALGDVDPMRVDMCNISFYQVHERVPLPPATDTIGSDYFLIHLVHDAALPGVLHNRHIVNFHTPERKTDAGFFAYQLRLTKFFLSMLYFNFIYEKMGAAGASMLDDRDQIRADVIAGFTAESARLAVDDNVVRLDSLDKSYRALGGRYAVFADLLARRREALLAEARQDIEDFALLTEIWQPLIEASRVTTLGTGGNG